MRKDDAPLMEQVEYALQTCKPTTGRPRWQPDQHLGMMVARFSLRRLAVTHVQHIDVTSIAVIEKSYRLISQGELTVACDSTEYDRGEHSTTNRSICITLFGWMSFRISFLLVPAY